MSAHGRLTGTGLQDGGTARDFVVETFEACGPMNDWITANIGKPGLAMGRR